MMVNDWWWLVGQVFTAGAVYGAIRSDLRSHREKLQRLEVATDAAHARIDRIFEKGK